MFRNSSKITTPVIKKEPFPSSPMHLIDAGVILLSFLASIVFSILIIIFKEIAGIGSLSQMLHVPSDVLQIFSEYLVATFILLVFFFFILRRHRLSLINFGFRPLPIFKTLAYVILGFMVTFVMWIIVAPIILIYLPEINLEQSQEIFKPDMTILAQILLVFYAVILGPFIEEVVFRGIILTAVSNRWGFIVGIVLSTLIWSLLHFQINIIIFTSLFGIVLSYIYLKSQSLWPSFLTHVFKNLIAVIAIYIFGLY